MGDPTSLYIFMLSLLCDKDSRSVLSDVSVVLLTVFSPLSPLIDDVFDIVYRYGSVIPLSP